MANCTRTIVRSARTAPLLALLLAACSSTSLPTLPALSLTDQKAAATPAPTPAVARTVIVAPDAKQPTLVVALSPIFGPPAAFTDALVRELNTAATEKGIALMVDKDASAEYILRGNFIASASPGKVSLAYNWDVLDKANNRVGRSSDEEIIPVPGKPAAPWANIPPATVKMVAEKAVAAMLPLAKPAAVAQKL